MTTMVCTKKTRAEKIAYVKEQLANQVAEASFTLAKTSSGAENFPAGFATASKQHPAGDAPRGVSSRHFVFLIPVRLKLPAVFDQTFQCSVSPDEGESRGLRCPKNPGLTVRSVPLEMARAPTERTGQGRSSSRARRCIETLPRRRSRIVQSGMRRGVRFRIGS